MKKTLLALLVLAAVGIATYYFVFSKAPVNPEQNPYMPENSSPMEITNPETSLPATTSTVNIKDFAFSIPKVTVGVGSTITWVNQDSAPHTVTSDSDSLLDSGNLATGESFSFTFTESGTYTYHCAVHPSMKGTIVIE